MMANNGRERKGKAVEQPDVQLPPKQQAMETYYSTEQWPGVDFLQ